MAAANGLMRSCGIRFPVKQPEPPVVTLQDPDFNGSRMLISRFWLSNVWEKSPRRSSSVGILSCERLPGSRRGSMSCDQKKNSLSRFWLYLNPGRRTGPPIVYVVLLYL